MGIIEASSFISTILAHLSCLQCFHCFFSLVGLCPRRLARDCVGLTSEALGNPQGLARAGGSCHARIAMTPALPFGSPACDMVPAVTSIPFYLAGPWTYQRATHWAQPEAE